MGSRARSGNSSTPERRRALRRLLVDAVEQRSRPEVPGRPICTPREVLEAAERHRVTPAVYLLVKEAEVPEGWIPPLRLRYQEQLLRHLNTDADLALAAGVLRDLGAPWVVMKGPVLSDRLWPRPDMRQYFDLDVLVDRRRFGAAIEALVARGARLVDRNWPLIHHQMRAELSLELPYGTPLDLHWDLVNDSKLRSQWRLPIDAMVERALQVPIGNLRLPTFDGPDTLISLAQHAALAGATRLVWLKDVERAAAVPGLDWVEVDRRARTTGCTLALTMTLAKAGRVLDRPVRPAGWHRDRGVWTALGALVDRAVPFPGLSDGERTGQLLYRSARRDSRSSVRAAWASVTHGDAPVPVPAGADESVNPLHVDVPAPHERAAYFEALGGSAAP